MDSHKGSSGPEDMTSYLQGLESWQNVVKERGGSSSSKNGPPLTPKDSSKDLSKDSLKDSSKDRKDTTGKNQTQTTDSFSFGGLGSKGKSLGFKSEKAPLSGQAGLVHRLAEALDVEGDKPPDAVSEKDRGNNLFKLGKYEEALECYSRSIAMQPSAVAFANRAMAELKLKLYKEAEEDCTEALSLDDQYVKAYSRRATCRQYLRRYHAALEDLDLALDLEPESKDLQKQRMAVLTLLDREEGRMETSRQPKDSPISMVPRESRKVNQSEDPDKKPVPSSSKGKEPIKSLVSSTTANLKPIRESLSSITHSIPSTKRTTKSTSEQIERDSVRRNVGNGAERDNSSILPSHVKTKASVSSTQKEETEPLLKSNVTTRTSTTNPRNTTIQERDTNATDSSQNVPNLVRETEKTNVDMNSPLSRSEAGTSGSGSGRGNKRTANGSISNERNTTNVLVTGVTVTGVTATAVSRAAAAAQKAIEKNIEAPKTAYEFEKLWKMTGGERESQARILEKMEPTYFPTVFKNSLSASLLIDILQTLDSHFFPEKAEMGVNFLENLTKVPRFTMTTMFLTKKDKEAVRHLWEQSKISSSQDLQNRLEKIRELYRL